MEARSPLYILFGIIGFVKTVLLDPWKDHRLAESISWEWDPCHRGFSISIESRCQWSTGRDPCTLVLWLEKGYSMIWVLFSHCEVEWNPITQRPHHLLWIQGSFGRWASEWRRGVLDDMPAAPAPRRKMFQQKLKSHSSRKLRRRWNYGWWFVRGDDDDDDEMNLGMIDRLNHCIHWYHQDVSNKFASWMFHRSWLKGKAGRFRGPSGRAPFSDEGGFIFSEAPFEGSEGFKGAWKGFNAASTALQGGLKRLQGGLKVLLGFQAWTGLEAFSGEGGSKRAWKGLQGAWRGGGFTFKGVWRGLHLEGGLKASRGASRGLEGGLKPLALKGGFKGLMTVWASSAHGMSSKKKRGASRNLEGGFWYAMDCFGTYFTHAQT